MIDNAGHPVIRSVTTIHRFLWQKKITSLRALDDNGTERFSWSSSGIILFEGKAFREETLPISTEPTEYGFTFELKDSSILVPSLVYLFVRRF